MTVPSLPEVLDHARRRGHRIAALALGAALLLALVDVTAFLQGWLVGFLFWIAFPLGALALVLLHNLTGGAWGLPVRRTLEAATRTLPLFALLFLPLAASVLFHVGHVWEWADAELVATDKILQHKKPYLNGPFFVGRAAFYFLVWIVISRWLGRLTDRQDRTGDPLAHRMRQIAGPGLGLYGLTMTFAAVDWGMSLEPHQFSTIYGVRFIVGQVLTAMAFAIVMADRLRRREPFGRWISENHFHDLGKLLFAFVMLWAYIGFSDYLITWSGNLAEETPTYLRRTTGVWGFTAILLLVLHFFLPFGVLLSRVTKRNPAVLSTVAIWILMMRVVDFYWLLVPGFLGGRDWSLWLQVPLCLLGIGALFSASLARAMRGRPLISLQDASLQGELERAPS